MTEDQNAWPACVQGFRCSLEVPEAYLRKILDQDNERNLENRYPYARKGPARGALRTQLEFIPGVSGVEYVVDPVTGENVPFLCFTVALGHPLEETVEAVKQCIDQYVFP